jgi:hypothetical protein
MRIISVLILFILASCTTITEDEPQNARNVKVGYHETESTGSGGGGGTGTGKPGE